MSVKFVVATLVVAVAVASKVLTVKTCTGSTASDCSCDASAENTKNYTIGECAKQSGMGNLYWKADCAEPADFAVRGYKDEGCTEAKKDVPTQCTEISGSTKMKAQYISDNDHKSQVVFLTGCTSQCDQHDTNCASTTFFFDEIGRSEGCKMIEGRRYTLKNHIPDQQDPFTYFLEHKMDDCSDVGVEFSVSRYCSVVNYKQATCTPEDGAVIKSCRFKNDCSICDTTKVPLKEYKKLSEEETLYLASCPASSEEKISFDMYASVKTYSKTCTSGTSATCEVPTTTTTATTSATSTSATSTSATSATTETASSGNNNDNSSGNNDDNSGNTTDDAFALTRSVGVLCLIMCVLACI